MGTRAAADYSIAAVSKLTGVGCHALRVWERRYGFPIPRRTPAGHRRFGADQVATLVLVARELRQGRSIGDLMAEVHRGGLPCPGGPTPTLPVPSTVAALLDRLQQADFAGSEAEYARIAAGLSPAEAVREALDPALVELGERWFRGECDVFQEHYASSFLRRKIQILLDRAQRANDRPGRAAILGTVQGERHEGGVLILGLMLELAGWRAKLLGVDLPAREYQRAIDAWKPDVLCLSFVLSRNINKRFSELAGLGGAPIFVGGRSILNYQALARRHGLIPLVGPAEAAVPQIAAAVDGMCGRRAVPV